MSNETDAKSHEAHDGDGVERCDKTDNDTKEPREGKQRSVSFNRDVHVKRFGKPRERGTSSEYQAPVKIRKEPFTHLSEEQLIEEANKVLAQAQSVTCTADNPPEKFFSLPHRRKFKEDKSLRRSNEDGDIPEEITKLPLGRSTSDVTPRKKKERTSLSTLFRKSQKNKPEPVVVKTKPIVVVKRSKSDVSDLKSNTSLNKTKPIRKRSGSETEEFLKSLRNKKSQLSPIIESSPREDYFKTTSPLDEHQKQKDPIINNKTVNPIEKPPRQNKTPEKPEPKPPIRNKRGKSSEKELSPPISETPKRKTEIRKTNLSDEIDSKNKEENENTKIKSNTTDVADKIKDSIRKIEENVYGEREMIHSSQQPPDKLPLTRGSTVNQMVNILIKDQNSPPPMSHLISSNATNINQPFSYTKPSTSPDPNLFIRTTSPDRVPTPVNKMNGKGVVYAQVRKEPSETRAQHNQSFHKMYPPSKDKYGHLSDEDEGLGYEERHKLSIDPAFNYEYKNGYHNSNNADGYFVKESPITPRYREYKRMNFDEFEPTYANGNDHDGIDTFRGRADGMDTKKKTIEPDGKPNLDFNELSHRRELLESRLNARRFDREKNNLNDPILKYVMENDPIYEAEKRMKQTEKYVNDTVKYYRHTLERDGFESTVTEDYKYDLDDNKHKYHTEYRKSHKVIKDDGDRREFLDSWEQNDYKDKRKVFPPEPEYEPPSLEFHHGKPISSPDEYKEKKYKIRKQFIANDIQSGQKYRKDDIFGKRKGHYASNPEIAQEREDDYANLHYNPKQETYHNSLRRPKGKERDFKNYSVRRRDSRDSRDYYREQSSPRRYDLDNRLVDSGIENDFRLNSSGEIPRSRHRRNESDDMRNTSLFLVSERQHTEDNNVSEQIYANTESFLSPRDNRSSSKRDYIPKYVDDNSVIDRKRYEKSPSRNDDKVSAKPPKAAKKLSGLEKVKQLFSRDSSKKSKKEKEVVQPKTRTRVLKSPEHLARDDPEYRRYTDPEPSDNEVKKKEDKNERRYKYSREDVDRYRSSDSRESIERRREERRRESDIDDRFERTSKETRMYKEHHEGKRRYHSSDRDSDHRASELEGDRRRTKYTPLDSPALAERYRERRRLATPSPTPSPPRRQPSAQTSNNWFKSLDRLGKKRDKTSKVEKESIVTTEDESTRHSWSKPSKPLGTPSKNLRFFGDTDPESDTNIKQSSNKVKSHQAKSHGTLRKTVSNSSTGLDEVDHSELSHKSYSLSNLHREEKSESPRTKEYYKRNLQNISEIQSNSEAESNFDRKLHPKPPISPYERSRSHSSSKTLKATKADVRRHGADDRSSSDLRSSKQELHRDMKHRRRTPVTNSGESSTEGDSSHQSQRSVVYLHATTVGDIPDPGRVSRHRSRDDVSSVMSSNVQVKTTTKSFSLFAPWTPRHHNDQYDVHYEQKPRKSKQRETAFKKSSSTKNLNDDRPVSLQKNKSYSQTTLSRRTPNASSRLSNSSSTLYRRDKRGKENDVQNTMSRKTVNGRKSKSSEILNKDDRDRVSRSVSIPKEKKAGWFKLTSKNKKQETSRVR
ncbi:uncharacterized protein LOC121735240 [Aricia agestis]|uniref:uncharacterized protein LOC121735240 n=1 Tax=Aricia agestis TaxID=91739 RepID=UPI001C206F62|nr:uncharacterized protein LOC121735240 [Aricia agestis]